MEKSYEGRAAQLRQTVAELEAKLAHPETLTEKEREVSKQLLRVGKLELRDLERASWGD